MSVLGLDFLSRSRASQCEMLFSFHVKFREVPSVVGKERLRVGPLGLIQTRL